MVEYEVAYNVNDDGEGEVSFLSEGGVRGQVRGMCCDYTPGPPWLPGCWYCEGCRPPEYIRLTFSDIIPCPCEDWVYDPGPPEVYHSYNYDVLLNGAYILRRDPFEADYKCEWDTGGSAPMYRRREYDVPDCEGIPIATITKSDRLDFVRMGIWITLFFIGDVFRTSAKGHEPSDECACVGHNYIFYNENSACGNFRKGIDGQCLVEGVSCP